MGYALDDEPNCTKMVFYSYVSSQNQNVTMVYIESNVLDWLLEVAARICGRTYDLC